MKRFFSRLHYLAFLIGALVLVSVLIEFAPSLPRLARNAYYEAQGIAQHELAHHPAYGDVDWLNDYWFEQAHKVRARWEPYVYWRMAETSGKHINIDALGRRRTVQPPVPDSDAFLIYTFGGSTMWGLGVPDRYTLPSQLADLIRGRKAKIVNYGEQGYVTTQSYLQLLVALRRGERPDLVIFYDGYNDLLVPTFGSGAGLPHNEQRRRDEFKLSLKEARFRTYVQALKFAYGRSLSWAETTVQWLQPQKPAKMSQAEIWQAAQEAVEVYAFNLDLVRDLGRRFGFASRFFLQPLRHVDAEALPAPGGEASIFQAGYRLAHTALAADNDVIWLDAALTGEPDYYIDDVHLTHAGNRVVAGEMLKSLDPLLPPSK